MAGVAEPDGSATSSDAPARRAAPRRRASLAADLTILAVVGVLLVAAVAAGVGAISQQFYSPTAFVERYLGLLSAGRAADALLVSGVAVDASHLEAAGMPVTASEALLRTAALAALSDIEVVSEVSDGDVVRVTATYRASGYPGTSTFLVERAGSIGLAPTWRFAQTPLAVIDLTVLGSMAFAVNGFEVDKRQVSIDGVDADPVAAVPLLVFSPGVYTVSVDTAMAVAPSVAVLSDSPAATIPVTVQAEATPEFVDVVQERVNEFLAACTEQQVLQPTACPFGHFVTDRLASLPTWTIVEQPVVSVVPDGELWRIPQADAMARIDVDVRSLYDGTVRTVSEDVPFHVTGEIRVLPDGTASIVVGAGG